MVRRTVVAAVIGLLTLAPARADAEGEAMRKALERHAPSLVRVEATASVSVEGLPGLGEGARRMHEVSATGVVVSADGLVVVPTRGLDPAGDAFELLGARPRWDLLSLSVVGADGRVREAEWVGRDRVLGLALIRVAEAGRAGLTPVAFAAALPEAGERVLALSLGSARLGRPRTVEQARVAFKAQAAPAAGGAALLGLTPRLPGALGALVTTADGAPIGIVGTLPEVEAPRADALVPDALADRRQGLVLAGAAVTALLAKPPVEATTGAASIRRERAWLGARTEVVTPELAQANNLDIDTGVRLAKVYEGPAKVAGLQAGDILVRMDDEALDLDPGESFDDLVEDLGVGTKIAFVIRRAGQPPRPVEVTLGRGPVRPRDAERASIPELGVLLRALTFYDKDDLGLAQDGGAVVVEVEPDGVASRGGLRAGDVILKIEADAVGALKDLQARLVAPGQHSLTVRRRAEELTLRVRRQQ